MWRLAANVVAGRLPDFAMLWAESNPQGGQSARRRGWKSLAGAAISDSEERRRVACRRRVVAWAMGFRFSRRIRIVPGVRLNFSKRGLSASFGTRGLWYTVSRRRRRGERHPITAGKSRL